MKFIFIDENKISLLHEIGTILNEIVAFAAEQVVDLIMVMKMIGRHGVGVLSAHSFNFVWIQL
ncbi:hypothetical protein D3C71_2058020 [compost metagenome]